MILKIAVCEDDAFWRNRVKDLVNEKYAGYGVEYRIDTFDLASELITGNVTEEYDLLFIDFEFPRGISGMEAARKIRETNKWSQFIFVTNYETYAYDAYDVEAIGYIVKPIKEDVFERICYKAYAILEKQYQKKNNTGRKLKITMERYPVEILLDNIVYIEKNRNVVNIYTEDGEKYTTYNTISKMYQKLDKELFVQISSGVIVNWSYVDSVVNYSMKIHFNGTNKIEFPVSRMKYHDTREKFLLLIKER